MVRIVQGVFRDDRALITRLELLLGYTRDGFDGRCCSSAFWIKDNMDTGIETLASLGKSMFDNASSNSSPNDDDDDDDDDDNDDNDDDDNDDDNDA